MSQSAEIQGKLSLKLSDFSAALAEAEKQQAASTGRLTGEEKKAAAEREKMRKKQEADDAKALKDGETKFKAAVKAKADAEKAAAEESLRRTQKAAAEEEAQHKEGVRTAKDALKSVRGGLSGGNTGEIAASGFEAIGALGGPIAGVAAGAALIAKSMYDAAENARAVKKELNELNREGQGKLGAGAGTGDLVGQSGKISEHLRQMRLAKAESLERLGIFGGPTENTVSNTLFGSMGEHINNQIGAMTGKPTAMEGQLKQEAALLAQRKALLSEAADTAGEDVDAAAAHIKLGEREGALAESKLRTMREIKAVTAELGQQGLGQQEIDRQTDPISHRGSLEQNEIARKDAEAQRAIDEAHQSAADRGDVEQTGARSKIGAGQMEIERLDREAALKRQHAGETDNVDRKREFNSQAGDLDLQARMARFKLTEQQRELDERLVDLGRAGEQSQIGLLALTGQEVVNRAQIDLLTKRIEDNKRRMAYADEAGKMALQAQNTELDTQIKKLAIIEQMKTPQQKKDERAAGRRGRRAEHAVEAKARDAADRLKRGAQHQVKIGDAVLRGLNRPEGKAENIGKALDESQLAKDLRVIAQAVLQPAKAG